MMTDNSGMALLSQMGNQGSQNAMNNPLMWLITLAFLGKQGGGLLGGDTGGAALSDTLGRIQDGISAAAVGNANQTSQITETLNRIAADAAACCCDTKLELANQSASIREGNLIQTNQISLGFAATNLEACKTANALTAAITDCRNVTEVSKDQILNQTNMQTAALTLQNTLNTQAIIDKCTQNQIDVLNAALLSAKNDLNNCQQNGVLVAAMQAQTAAIMAAITATCKKGNGD